MGWVAMAPVLVTIGAMALTIWARLAIRTRWQLRTKMFR